MFACLFKTLRPHSFVSRPSSRSGLRVHVAASANSATHVSTRAREKVVVFSMAFLAHSRRVLLDSGDVLGGHLGITERFFSPGVSNM